ncbi:MAG: hypothetical protein QW666_04255 [Candidatus Woesearchaeota archaeon]
MKKIICLLVMAVFLISLASVAFAANENASAGKSGSDGVQKVTQQTSKDFEQKRNEFMQQAQAKRQELVEKREQAMSKLGNKVKEMKEKRNAFREKYLSKKEELKAKAEKARERKEEAKAKHIEAKERLAEKKSQLAECKGNDSEECVALRAGARKDAGEFLSNVADRILAMLERTREQVEKSKLSDAEKVTLLDQINVKMAEVASTKDTAEMLDENSTKEEIAEVAKTLKDAWKDTKDTIKKGVGLAAADRLGGVIVKSEHLQAKLEKVISKLADKGIDVSGAQDLKTDFDQKLAEAKNLHEEAKALFKEGKVPEAAKKIQESHAALKEAHKILKDIVRELKGTKEGREALNTTEAEGTAVTGTTAIADETSEQAAETTEETTEATEEGATEATGSAALDTEDSAEDTESETAVE